MSDVAFGPLTFHSGRWCGSVTHAHASVAVSLAGDEHGPERRVRAAAVDAVQHMPVFDRVAREFLAARTGTSSPDLTLAALEVRRPAAAWIRSEIAADHTFAATGLSPDSPVVVLMFEILNAGDVYDVVFLGGRPITTDRH